MSPQFAGIASAVVNQTYVDAGIDLAFLPICPVGLEQERVRIHQNESPSSVSLGSVEQNIFIPTLFRNPQIKTTAVAAMFNESPLCIASLPDSTSNIIGTHEDTVLLMKRVFPDHEVVASPRCNKITDLTSGTVGAIQAYTTTEVPTLRHMGKEPIVTLMEGHNGAKLGYSQVIFAADECLTGDKKEVVQTFCKSTFEGWAHAIENPEQAVEMVREARKMLNLDEEENDHWHSSDDFELEFVKKCNEAVEKTKKDGSRYGVIDSSRWSDATKWLLNGKDDVSKEFGFDGSVY